MEKEFLSRIYVNYTAQFLFSATIFFIFRYFARVYERKFLKFWSWSWLAFSLCIIITSFLVALLRSYTASRLILSLTAQSLAFLHIAFLLAGTWELANKKPIEKKNLIKILVVTLLAAFLTVILYSNDPSASFQRSLLRFGVRSFLFGAGFIISALIIFFNSTFKRGVGRTLLGVSFLAYGAEQLILFSSTFFAQGIPYDFGLIDLFLIAMMGLSMVMWLMEDERQKLKKANKELDSFLYSTSHDLRAPLASILGLTNLGQLDVKDEVAQKYFKMIEDRVRKLDLVISDILHLSRSTRAELKLETIDFNHLLDDVIADVKFNEGAKQITLRHERKPDSNFYGDYGQMKIILGNLISNAVKYHRLDQADPFIAVTFSKSREGIVFTVEDNGQGIAPENQDKVFEMFYRASLTTSGTGLGLYIVKEAVRKLHGEIKLKSTPQRGSKFSVTLPQ